MFNRVGVATRLCETAVPRPRRGLSTARPRAVGNAVLHSLERRGRGSAPVRCVRSPPVGGVAACCGFAGAGRDPHAAAAQKKTPDHLAGGLINIAQRARLSCGLRRNLDSPQANGRGCRSGHAQRARRSPGLRRVFLTHTRSHFSPRIHCAQLRFAATLAVVIFVGPCQGFKTHTLTITIDSLPHVPVFPGSRLTFGGRSQRGQLRIRHD